MSQTPRRQDHFGELRSLLQSPASEDTWSRLCASLDAYPRPELEQVAVPYAASIVRRWPERLRAAPQTWIDALIEREGDLPQAGVVASLSLRNRFVGDDEVDAIAESAWLGELRALDLGRHHRMPWSHDQLDHDRVRRLGESRSMHALRELSIAGHHLRPDALEILLLSPHFSSLRSLDFSFNNLGFLRHRDLAVSHSLPKLEHFGLRDVGLTFVGVEALAAHGLLSELSSIDLSDNVLGAEGIARLAARGALDGLHTLALERAELDATSLTITLEFALGLTRLDLAGNPLGDSGAQLVARSAQISRLTHLDLSETNLTGDGVRELAAARMSALTNLKMTHATLEQAGLLALARAPWLEGLTHLHLDHAVLPTRDHFSELLARELPTLEHLSLSHCGLTDDELERLTGAPALVELDLSHNALTDEGVEKLSRLTNLKRLDLRYAGCSREAADALQEKLGEHVDVQVDYGYQDYGYDEYAEYEGDLYEDSWAD